ncbi:MAG: metalloregulator ArsR/SmtB family transcription factor [Rhodospirillales bacterium]|nr:metalloregulator ArsR/SmtB family transcription factor [Rhodospirillales bacterium]
MNTNDAAIGFAALAQDTRVRLLRLLAEHGASGMAAGEIAARLGVPSSTLSFHLSAMEQAGLVQATRQGRQLIYAVRINGLRSLLAFVTETCCAARPELCGDLARLLPEVPEERPPMAAAFNVLFLCTQNSARSIMAEAILSKMSRGSFHAYSAGSQPATHPVPDVIAKLKALGHDVTSLRSKSWSEFMGPDAPRMDFVITLCDTPRGQRCPDFGDTVVTAAWPLPDPAKFIGKPAEKGVMLSELYAGIRRRLEMFCSLPFSKLDRMAAKARLADIADLAHVRS